MFLSSFATNVSSIRWTKGMARLMLCLTSIGGALGTLCSSMSTAAPQDEKAEAVAALEKAGALVFRADQAPEPFGKELKKLYGDSYSVSFKSKNISDDDLVPLGKLPSVCDINLRKTPIGDSGVSHVVKAKGLISLNLACT